MTFITSADRERQRFEHLVLGRPRPRAEPAPTGKRKKGRKIAVRLPEIVWLAPGIEERVALREDWSHKSQGTPETHEAAYQAQQRPGSIARLYASGAINKDQLAAAEQILEAYRAITADVAIKTASWETRIEGGPAGGAEMRMLGNIRGELAYDWWRSVIATAGVADPLIAVIVHDIGLTIAAAQYGISTRRLRGFVAAALDLWRQGRGVTRRAAEAILDE